MLLGRRGAAGLDMWQMNRTTYVRNGKKKDEVRVGTDDWV